MDALVSKGLDDPAVAPAFAGLRDIGLQQNARLQQPLRRALSFADQRLQMLAFPRAQPHHILLYRNVLSRHARLRRQIATEANHLFLSNWLKRATSPAAGAP